LSNARFSDPNPPLDIIYDNMDRDAAINDMIPRKHAAHTSMVYSSGREAEGRNEYLATLLMPQRFKSPTPDLDASFEVLKPITGSNNVTGLTNLVVVNSPFSDRPTTIWGARTTNPINSLPVIGWGGIFALDDDPQANYSRCRVVSAITEVFSDTVPSGAFAINGRISAGYFMSPAPFQTMDPDSVTSYNTTGVVNNVGILDGVVSLALPARIPSFLPRGSSYLNAGDSLVFEVNNTSNPSCIILADSRPVQIHIGNSTFPQHWRGFIEIDFEFAYTSTVAQANGTTATVELTHITSGGALSVTASRTFNTTPINAGAQQIVSGTARLYTPYPTARISISLGASTASAVSLMRVVARCPGSEDESREFPMSIMYVSGLDAATQVCVNQHYNYECVPNAALSKDVVGRRFSGEVSADITRAYQAISYMSIIQPVMSRSNYRGATDEFLTLTSRDRLNQLYTLGWGDVVNFGKRAMSGIYEFGKATKPVWQPLLTGVNPYAAGIASAVFTKGSDCGPQVNPTYYTLGSDSEIDEKDSYSVNLSGTRLVDSVRADLAAAKLLRIETLNALSTARTSMREIKFQYCPTVNAQRMYAGDIVYILTGSPLLAEYDEVSANISASRNMGPANLEQLRMAIEWLSIHPTKRKYISAVDPETMMGKPVDGSSCGLTLLALLAPLPIGFKFSGQIARTDVGFDLIPVEAIDEKLSAGNLFYVAGNREKLNKERAIVSALWDNAGGLTDSYGNQAVTSFEDLLLNFFVRASRTQYMRTRRDAKNQAPQIEAQRAQQIAALTRIEDVPQFAMLGALGVTLEEARASAAEIGFDLPDRMAPRMFNRLKQAAEHAASKKRRHTMVSERESGSYS